MLQPGKTQYIIQIVTGKQLLNSVKTEKHRKAAGANCFYKYRKDATLL